MSKIEELAWKHGVFSEPVTLMQYYNNIVALMVLIIIVIKSLMGGQCLYSTYVLCKKHPELCVYIHTCTK